MGKYEALYFNNSLSDYKCQIMSSSHKSGKLHYVLCI
jgi:hypothetical protein